MLLRYCTLQRRKRWFLHQNCFNHHHFSSSLLCAVLFLHCCIKLVACERSLWFLSDCLWYLPCIFFVPVIAFWFEDSQDYGWLKTSVCREIALSRFLRNCILIAAPYFYITVIFIPMDWWITSWTLEWENWFNVMVGRTVDVRKIRTKSPIYFPQKILVEV